MSAFLTSLWPGWYDSPIPPCVYSHSSSPPVLSGSVLPGAIFVPTFTSSLKRTFTSSRKLSPFVCTAAWHVSAKRLFSIVMPERLSLLCMPMWLYDRPGMQSVSSNDRPRIVTSSDCTCILEWPVNFAGPALPVVDVSVSSFSITRTVSSYVPSGTVTTEPASAASIRFCRPVRGSGSITYTDGVHAGETYTVPLPWSTEMSSIWSFRDDSPTIAMSLVRIAYTDGLFQSWLTAYSMPFLASKSIPVMSPGSPDTVSGLRGSPMVSPPISAVAVPRSYLYRVWLRIRTNSRSFSSSRITSLARTELYDSCPPRCAW